MFSQVGHTERSQERAPGNHPSGSARRRLIPSRERIARRAYQIWQSHGCPCGTEAQDWLQAEDELTAAQFFRAGRIEARRRRRVAGTAAAGKPSELRCDEASDIIEEASIESFPASDAPAWIYGASRSPRKPR